MSNDKLLEGDYRWSDEKPVSRILKHIDRENIDINNRDKTITHTQNVQIKRKAHQINVEEQKINDISDIESIEKIEFPIDISSNIKSSNIKSLSGNGDLQPKKEEKEQVITKSDIQDVKNLLKDILHWLKEIEGFKTHPYDEKGRGAIEEGQAHIYKYRNYYDITNTIKIAGPVNPNDFDSPVYNKERIFEDLERYADIVNVTNGGTGTLFVIISHGGRTNFSQEAPIFPGEVKTYYQVYELRLRSPEKGLQYRVTEYMVQSVSQTSLIPIELASLHDVPLPDAGDDWLETDIVPLISPTTLRIEVAVSKNGIFSAAINNGGNTQVVDFRVTSGPELIEDGVYIFELLVNKGDTVNFRFSDNNGKIKILRIQEIDASIA